MLISGLSQSADCGLHTNMRANVVANEDGDGYFDEQIIRSTCLGSVGLGDSA